MKEDLKIYLENDKKKQDEKMKELGINFLLYYFCYQRALYSVLRYIDFATQVEKENNSNEYRKKRESLFLKEERASFFKSDFYQCNSNIIAFMGKRGTGKTTALREFCSILKQYHYKREEWNAALSYFNNDENNNENNCVFHVLPPIDASVLDTKEDLLELIFAEMYQVFKKEREDNYSYGKNDEYFKRIVKEFDDVYQHYHNINHNERVELLGESVLVKLQNISSSQKVRNEFEKLVNDFLYILNKEYRNSYLVITVDDIDVNLDKGYEMLEQIHKYLWNPRVIVLIAMDFEQMCRICERHFANSLTISNIDNIIENEARHKIETIRELCREYLLKIIPLRNRIYQPDEEVIARKIWLSKSNTNTSWFAVKEEAKEEKLQKIKDYILWKIAEKTGIYYDSQGIKKHFFVPSTIRRLVSYDRLLDSMSRLSCNEEEHKNGSEILELYKQNYHCFHQDIVERMAVELLSYEELKLFRSILDRNIEKRAEYAVDAIHDWILSQKSRETQLFYNRDYSYTKLLEQIYELEQNGHKSLAECLIAVCTCEMVQEYYIYTHGEREEKEEACKNIVAFRGVTFGGNWFQNIILGNQIFDSIEYTTGISLANFSISKQFILDGIDLLWIDNLVSYVPCLECLNMLLSNVRDKLGFEVFHQWWFIFRVSIIEKQVVLQMTIRSIASTADFDMFGFIGKELENELYIMNNIKWKIGNYKEVVKKEFLDAIGGILQKEKSAFQSYKNIDELKHQIEEKVNKYSIWNNVEQLDNISFPFYNLDLSYNVMKRVKKEVINFSYDKRLILDYFRQVYTCVLEKLEAQDKFYTKGNFNTKFADKFRTNPVVNAVLKSDIFSLEDNILLDMRVFNELLERMIYTTQLPEFDELGVKD